MMNLKITLLMTLWLLLASCQPVNDDGVPSPTRVNIVESSIPASVATPEVETGVIVGRLISATNGVSLASQSVYLGERLPLHPGEGYLITLEVEGSPNGITDEDGYFFLAQVEPGEYPLIIWTPFKSHVISDVSGENELIIQVVAGETTELGELVVDWP